METDIEQVKIGITNFIGPLLSETDNSWDKQKVVAMLVERAFFTAKNEDNSDDLFALKPLYRGVIALNKKRISLLRTMLITENIKQQIEQYNIINENIQELLDRIKV